MLARHHGVPYAYSQLSSSSCAVTSGTKDGCVFSRCPYPSKKTRPLAKLISPTNLTKPTRANAAMHSPKAPSVYHYSSLLQSCIESGDFELGRSIHSEMLAQGVQPDPFLQTKILMLYARAGGGPNLDFAREMFDGMTERNLTSWNTMVLAYAQDCDYEEVMSLFYGMLRSGIEPDKFTFPSVIKACVALGHGSIVREIHGSVIKTGLNRHLVVGNTLVDGYSMFNAMNDAADAFNQIDEKNVVSWDALLRGFEKCLWWDECWIAFCDMMSSGGADPNHFTFAAAFRACGALGILDQGKQVHAKMIIYGYESDVFVGNTLIDMYANCGDKESLLHAFDSMTERNQISWNSVISALVQLGWFEEAMILFCRMQDCGYKIDRYSLGSILMACTGLIDAETGRQSHCYLVRRFLDFDVVLGSALLNMYSKVGHIEMAQRVFDRLKNPNVISWNSLLFGYVLESRTDEALQVYHTMKSKGTLADDFTLANLLSLSVKQVNITLGKQIHAHILRNIRTSNLVLETELIYMYAKCNRLTDAWKVFERMTKKNKCTWNAMIEGLEKIGLSCEALQLFYDMQRSGVSPDSFSLATILSACSGLSNLKKGKQVHAFLIRNFIDNHHILRCMLVNLYAECGDMDYAFTTFNKMSTKDVVLYNAMITALTNHGLIEEARHLFNHMEERDSITWNALLTAYAKIGFKVESFSIFQQMLEANVEPTGVTLSLMINLCASISSFENGKQLHALSLKKNPYYLSILVDSALINMYAKNGYIKEARRYFDRVKERNIVTWNSIINGYAKHGSSSEVLNLFVKMQDENIHPNDVTFLLLLSACCHAGLVEEGLAIFNTMLEEFVIEAREEHYACIVDLLGRAGRVDEAIGFISKMSVEPGTSTWGALLGACGIHRNVNQGIIAAQNLLRLDPRNSGYHMLMHNIYAASGRWKEAKEIKELMRRKGVFREPGFSWIEINNSIQIFHAGDLKHSQMEEMCTILRSIYHSMSTVVYF